MKESEQHRFENMRSLLDDKARELTMFQKQLRQQIARLVSNFHFLCISSHGIGKSIMSVIDSDFLLSAVPTNSVSFEFVTFLLRPQRNFRRSPTFRVSTKHLFNLMQSNCILNGSFLTKDRRPFKCMYVRRRDVTVLW